MASWHQDSSKQQQRQAAAAAAALCVTPRFRQAAISQHAHDGARCKEEQIQAVTCGCTERLLREPAANVRRQQDEAG